MSLNQVVVADSRLAPPLFGLGQELGGEHLGRLTDVGNSYNHPGQEAKRDDQKL